MSNRGQGVRTTHTVFSVVEALDQEGGATATAVADSLDISKSNAYDHLSTLQELDYVVKDGDRYQPGLKFLKHGVRAKQKLDFADHLESALEALAEETGEMAWFVVEEHGQAVYVEKALGEDAIQPYGRVGKRVDLHDIAAGKAILSELPRRRVHEIVDEHGLTRHTEHTITSLDRLFEELDTVREQGYATNENETFEGFRAVASPVSPEGDLQGAVVISGPQTRFEGERFQSELPAIVSRVANELELEILSQNNR
ncbi:IclR family transcriptional regulator [Halospeciosus flavus]|uniref:IclR family transcriptional regulator n=1 Tax=Halospeciosus flavus TaxID=3032283 RepID=UPI00361B878D